jgi:hypothetical protein
MLNNVVLAAEYGYFIKWKGEQVWEKTVNFGNNWMEMTEMIMQ